MSNTVKPSPYFIPYLIHERMNIVVPELCSRTLRSLTKLISRFQIHKTDLHCSHLLPAYLIPAHQ